MICLRVATYNVHKCRGIDWRVSLGRVLNVLTTLDADVIALQEVFERQARSLADDLRMDHRFAAARELAGDGYGNAVFSRMPIRSSVVHDLTISGREPRNCLRADLDLAAGECVRVFGLHLGTSLFERRKQAVKLLAPQVLNGDVRGCPRIVLGDFNEWTRGTVTQMLSKCMHNADITAHSGSRRTYPGVMPVLHLDHIYYDSALHLQQLRLHRTREALIASDHLPLVAEFRNAVQS